MIGGALSLALLAGLAAARTLSPLATETQAQAINDGYDFAFILGAILSLVTAMVALTQLADPKLPTTPVQFVAADSEVTQ